MINSTLNENSTNESPIQSPKKCKVQIYSNSLLSPIQMKLKKIYEDKNNLIKNKTDFLKVRNLESMKEKENPLSEENIDKNTEIKMNLKKGNLLDFDFLVGEILDKINFKNNLIPPKLKKSKKLRNKKRKINKANQYYLQNIGTEKKSK
jgi:hypothetical protein